MARLGNVLSKLWLMPLTAEPASGDDEGRQNRLCLWQGSDKGLAEDECDGVSPRDLYLIWEKICLDEGVHIGRDF